MAVAFAVCLIPKGVSANGKEIDIYLIAGQSNAAGFTKYKEADLKKLDSRYIDGFENIYYAGVAANPSGDNFNPNEVALQNVKAGFGCTAGQTLGAEVGIAEELSKYYNSETGKYAGIIKYGVGGTALLNNLGGQNQAKGNWVSPSYAQTLTEGVTEKTGGVYRLFLKEVEKQLQAYKAAGFSPVVKGMFWMQGESDRGKPAEYVIAFEHFANDVRSDLSQITGEDLKHMPIHVGLISRTFNSSSYSMVNSNKNFIKTQRKLSEYVTHCFIVESDVFDLNDAYGNIGSDNNHWNYNQIIEIGKLVGKNFKTCKHLYNQEIADAKHLKTSGTCSVNSVYYKGCLCGKISDSEIFEAPSNIKHKWGSYKTVVAATTTKTGTKQRVCSACGTVDTKIIAKKVQELNDGHTHVFNRENTDSKYIKTEGDCKQATIYWKSCQCGEKSNNENDTFGKVIGEHDFEDYVVRKEPTEDEPGSQERICKVCRYVEISELEPIGTPADAPAKSAHTQDWWIIVGVAVAGTVVLASLILFLIYKKKASKKNAM